MKTARISNKSNYIATVNYCDTPRSRRIGLLRSLIDEHSGILMTVPAWRQNMSGFANSIHMIGMKYPIFVLWLDAKFCVRYSTVAEPGFRFYLPPCGASFIAELHISTSNQIIEGDSLSVEFIDGLSIGQKKAMPVFPQENYSAV